MRGNKKEEKKNIGTFLLINELIPEHIAICFAEYCFSFFTLVLHRWHNRVDGGWTDILNTQVQILSLAQTAHCLQRC